MKKLLRIMIFIPLCGLLVVLGASLALSLYYSKNFPVNTWINGVYCTGKTLEEVNRELADRTPVPDITLIGAAGEQTTLSLAEADGQADYRQALKNYLQKHASYLWMRNLDRQPWKRYSIAGIQKSFGICFRSFPLYRRIMEGKKAFP